MFKFCGYNQFLAICATTKEIMLFYDHGFVLLRFLAVVTNNPLLALKATLGLTEKLDENARWLYLVLRFTNIFLVSSLFALLVMNFDQYLETSYPLFHRTSVTKRRLLTFLSILIVLEVILRAISTNELLFSCQLHTQIICALVTCPMLFINYKLFIVVRKCRTKKKSYDMRKFSFKNISSCMLAVACYVVLSIPTFVYIRLTTSSSKASVALDNVNIARMWARTSVSINSTFNCLIFNWKNKVLRNEGWKVIKSIKSCRQVQSQPEN